MRSAVVTPRRTALIALLLAALPWLLFSQYVSDDLFLYGYDAGQSHFARFKLIGEATRDEGGLALWQTGSYGGGPFHANLENPTLYPPILALAALFPPLLALNLTVLLHLSLATVGMFLLCLRVWRRISHDTSGRDSSRATTGLAGSALAGLCFGLNAFTRVDTFNLVIYGAAHALVPWVFLAAEGVLHSPRPRIWTAALALLLAAQVHTGSHWVYAYTGVGLGLWWLVEGLLGGPGPRRGALVWFPVAGLLVLLLIAPKLLPFFDWVGTTNRAGALDPADAKGVTIAGEGAFSWSLLWIQLGLRTGGGVMLLLPAFCLLLWRRRTVRLVLGLAALGIAIAAGLLHDVLLSHLPPFDMIRGAFRGWTLANAFLALGAGLGACRIVALLPRPADPGRRELLALLLLPALLPALLGTGRHQEVFENPYSYRQVLTLYPHWTDAAQRAGHDWRVMSLDVQEEGTRNEQFITAALGLETLAGFFGYAYPQAIARHAYGEGAPLDPALRLRRVGLLSVGYAIASDSGTLRPRRWDDRQHDPHPGGIDGDRVLSVEGARPRAFVPQRVAAIVGDRDAQALYALLDAPAFRADRASLIAFDSGDPPTAAERASFDAIVLVGDARLDPSDTAGEPAHEVLQVQSSLSTDDRARLAQLAARLSDAEPGGPASSATSGASTTPTTSAGSDGGRGQESDIPGARFERRSSRDVHAERRRGETGGWLVLSETWSLYGGWQAVSERGRSLPIRRADGVVSAVFLEPGERQIDAHYDPPAVRHGLLLGGLGLAGVVLLAWPRRRPEAQRT